MHFPLVFPTSALLIATFIISVSSGPARRKRDIQYCTDDDILGPLSNYLPFQADVTQFCSTLINIQNVDITVVTTPISTVYSTTVIVGTTTSTVTLYTTTATVTATSAVLELKRRNEAQLAARAAVTDAPKLAYKEIQARQAAAATSTNFDASAISEGLVSACSCLYITPGTNYITATASTSIREEGVIGRGLETDTVTSIAPGVTTTTVLVNSTSYILPVGTGTTSSSIVSISSLSSYSLISSMSISSSMTSSMSSVSTSSTMSTLINPISASPATTSSTARPIPTGCPYINGTFFSSGDPCQSYQYICGVNYPDGNFYNLEEFYDSLEQCAEDVCGPANSGETTPCLGVVWNAARSNCRQLMSLANPFYDPSTVGALSVKSNAPSCQNIISSSSSTMSSPTSTPYFANISTSATSNMPVSANISTSLPMNTSTTWSYATGTGSWPLHNHTRSWNGTWPSNNFTWSNWQTANSSSSTLVISGSPIATSNNTCPISTATSTITKLATLYSGNYTFTTTETQYVNSLPNNASTTTQLSLVTVVITDLLTTTTESTTTVVNSYVAVTDTTYTDVYIALEYSTMTETLIIMETDVATTTTTMDSTEIDSQITTMTTIALTETDVLTLTTTDSTDTTTTTSFASTESDVATFTTTDSSTTTTTTIVSTETDIITAAITANGNPVAGRSGKSWWIF